MGFVLTAECTTEETGLDGVRHSCTSQWDVVTAPEDHVINRDSTKVSWISQEGSSNDIDLLYEDFVEIVANTGLKFPKTLKIRASARGPSGYSSGRGWSKVRLTGEFVKYR